MSATSVGLVSSLQWETTIDCTFDTEVADAIADHLRQVGVPCPPDDLFGAARWLVPVGTELQTPEWAAFNGRSSSPCIRVDFANGLTVVLLVGWSDLCGCETCSGKPSLRVLEVHRG